MKKMNIFTSFLTNWFKDGLKSAGIKIIEVQGFTKIYEDIDCFGQLPFMHGKCAKPAALSASPLGYECMIAKRIVDDSD